VVRAKRIKDLILKTLKVFYSLMQSYQRALVKMIEADLSRLPHDYMIAQCNNCFTFFEAMEDLIQPVRESKICTDDELEAAYSQRNIQQYNQKRVQLRLLAHLTDQIFRLKLRPLYEHQKGTGFFELDMNHILNESFKLFEDYAEKMSKSTQRQAWTGWLE
jgi:hypothetical protein